MIESKGHKITPIDGDLAVSRNAEIGCDVDIHGKARVAGSLKVEGFLDAPNIKGAVKGLFATEEELKREYPNPRPGWCAIVLADDERGFLYLAKNREWEKQSEEAKPFEFIADSVNVFASKGELGDLENKVNANADDIYHLKYGMDFRLEDEVAELMLYQRPGDSPIRLALLSSADESHAGVMSAEDKRNLNNSTVKVITWNNDTDLSNMDDFVVAGVYDIKGEHTRVDDNLPILNTGGGHSFNARLEVLDSSIPDTSKDSDKCITQKLTLSNRVAGDGDVYIRTGRGITYDSISWEPWGKLQQNIEVGQVDTLDNLIDNGIYSGVWVNGYFNNCPLTFVCVVINDYFIGVTPRRISQFLYGLSKFDGSVVYKTRVWDDGKDKWSDWEILNKNEISSMITNAVDAAAKAFNSRIDNLIDGAPETLDTLKEIADWVESHEDLYQFLESIVELNTAAIEDEKTRAENAEKDIKRKAVDVETLGASVLQDKVNIYFRNLNGVQNDFNIPAATTEKAGVMSAEDKSKLKNLAEEGKFYDLNTYTSQGVYLIDTGSNEVQNYPIQTPANSVLRLTVTDSYDGNTHVIVQVLNMNNHGGGEGNVYIRSCQNGNWKPWGKLQTNVEVNAIGLGQEKTFDDLTDNGMYSGVNVYSVGTDSSGYPITAYETFVLVVINAYLTGGGISQLKYSLKDGKSFVETRTRTSGWSEWESVDTNVEDVINDLNAEIARAKHAEQTNMTAIVTESARAKEAEKANADAIVAEKKRAEKHLTDEVAKLKDGDTIVAQAREIHSRNGKTVTDSFLVRTTAGSGTIGDGVATLKSVGGNIVKNLVDGTFETVWSPMGSPDVIYMNDIVIVKTKATWQGVSCRFNCVINHKYYIGANFNADQRVYIMINSATPQGTGYATGNVWRYLSNIVTGTETINTFAALRSPDADTTFIATKPIVIDLTEIFSAGNEPDKATCDKLFGTMDALPQGLTIANPSVFKSTGWNQFNPDMVLEGKAVVDGAIVDGDKTLAVIPCLPCKVGVGENNGYHIHGDFGENTKVYLTPLNPMEVEGELYMHELALSEKGTYVPQIKGYMIVEVLTTANLCAHFLWSEDCDKNAYEPYYESIVELPKIPEMSEYGLAGIQSSGTLVCDEIDLVKGVYRKKIYAQDLSISGFWINSREGFDYFLFPVTVAATGNNIMCERYTSMQGSVDALLDKSIMLFQKKYICIRDDAYTTIEEFKASLDGVYAYYTMATPEEYPLPKVDNNYTSSDYGVEQFDGAVPCNANNLYYMRSLAGETRNFLDKMYANTAKTDAKEVADYITNNLADKIPLATTENDGLMSATTFSSIGEVIDITEEDEISFYVGSSTNKTVFNYYTKSDNCTITATLKNVVGDYYSVRFYLPSTYDLAYVPMNKCSNGDYFGSKSLIGLPKGSLIQIKVFTSSTSVGSVNENSVIEIREQSYKGNVRQRVDIFTSDTQLEVFEKMLYANNIGHCDVHFQMGTYTFDETLYDWMRSERMYSRAELPIGGNCRYFFNGSTLIGSYAGEDTHVAGNCNVLGCAMTSGNFELYDGTIIANDVVYGVHDDGGLNARGNSHLHKYSNMHIIYNGGSRAKNNALCKCIGGGTCKNLTVIIDNCVLEKYTENTNKDCVTYHGLSNNPSYQTKARIVIANTWMTGACRAYHTVQELRNETIDFIVSNCRTNVTSCDVDKLITWNNEPIS